MVRCNLSVLLAERNLKITKVSKDTGISRTTLTSLVNNYSQGIQFETLNTLCMYLNVRPDELITFVPVDIEFVYVNVNGELLDIPIRITKNSKVRDCGLCGDLYVYRDSKGLITDFDISINLWLPDNDGDDVAKENLFIIDAFRQLPRPFLTDFQNRIICDIESEFPDLPDTYNYAFQWSAELIS